MIIENKEALLKEREAAREELASYKCRILVCAGTGCVASGSEKIYRKMLELCQGMDMANPDIIPNQYAYA